MDSVKTLKAKLIKAKKKRDRLGKASDKLTDKYNELRGKVHNIERLIEKAEIKDKIHPVKVGEWYDYDLNGDVFFRINRRLIDNSFELFVVNIHNEMPSLSMIEMSQKEFFGHCKKIDRPPVDKIIDKIKSFIDD